jgi:hypothetical protein
MTSHVVLNQQFIFCTFLRITSELDEIEKSLPRPQALIKKFHASHYMKGLHEVVHRDEQAQGVMGLRHRNQKPERSYPTPLCAPIM